jgi:hypothetical protein
VVPEHPLQRQIADALRLEISPPGKVSRDGVVWWSVDHASYSGTAPGARVGRGIGQKKAAEKVQDPPPAHFYGRNRGMSLPRRVHSNNKHISFIARE